MEIPLFDGSNDTCASIAENSEGAHASKDVEAIVPEIDALVGDLFDISDEEIEVTREYCRIRTCSTNWRWWQG